MTSRSKWIFTITLGVIALLATGYFFKDKFLKKKEVPTAKSPTKKPEQQTAQIQQQLDAQQRALNSISQTQNTLRSIDEINKMNQFNQQLQKEMQRQDRQIGK